MTVDNYFKSLVNNNKVWSVTFLDESDDTIFNINRTMLEGNFVDYHLEEMELQDKIIEKHWFTVETGFVDIFIQIKSTP